MNCLDKLAWIGEQRQKLEEQHAVVATKGNYQARANAYIREHGKGKVVEYRVIQEPWRETRKNISVTMGTRVVAWAMHSMEDGNLAFNFSIFKMARKEFVDKTWAKGTAVEHALGGLFTTPIVIRFENTTVAEAVKANLGKNVSSMTHEQLQTFTRVDKADLHRIMREISRLGRKELSEMTVTLRATLSQEPIWNRNVSKEFKKEFHRQVKARRMALHLLAKGTTDKAEIDLVKAGLKTFSQKFPEEGKGPYVKNFFAF